MGPSFFEIKFHIRLSGAWEKTKEEHMSVFDWFSDLFSSGSGASSWGDVGVPGSITGQIGTNAFDDFAINPANGNPMVGGIGGLDVGGNPFGTDFSNDHMMSSAFDDSWSSSSGCGLGEW